MQRVRRSNRPRRVTTIQSVFDAYEPLVLIAPQIFKLLPEIPIEVEEVSNLDRLLRKLEVAHQRLDYRAAREVVGGQLDPAHDRQRSPLEGVVVIVESTLILAVSGPDHADGGNSERHEVALRVGRITLEIAVQAALLLGRAQTSVSFAKWSMPM